MILAGIVLLSIAVLILLVFIGYVIYYGGGSVGVKVYLPILLVFIVCAIAGTLMIVLNL